MLIAPPDQYILTHSDCLTAGHQDGGKRPKGAPIWVQVRRYNKDGPYRLCGRLAELCGSDVELFKVDTDIGTSYVTGRNIRLCSGDGRCTCEDDGHA